MRSTIPSTISALALAICLGVAGALVSAAEGGQAGGETRVPLVARSFIVEYLPSGSSAKHRRQTAAIASADGTRIVKNFDSGVFSGASIEHVQLAPLVDRRAAKVEDADNITSHKVTGVTKLHAQGIFGKGVKVGVVDTGIWYNHPALGGGFGPGFKVAGGWDFVGDGVWPINNDPKVHDDDPIDMAGHGTHVAGIIAGATEGWTGVAPEVELHAYKVFSTSGGTDTATLIEAFLKAYQDGMDIIAASIGGPNGGAAPATYKFSTQPAAGVDTLTLGITYGGPGMAPRIKTFVQFEPRPYEPEVHLPRDFTLGPGESKKVTVNFKNPDTLGWNESNLPLYGGKVVVAGSNSEILSVPYMGLGADLKARTSPIVEMGFPDLTSGPRYTPIWDKNWFKFNLSKDEQDYARFGTKLLWGTKELRFDWFGKLGNGSQIANGQYKIRLAVLKPFGNPHASDNWDVMPAPVVEGRGRY
ncbi:hypothetical protein GGTG_11819 [Gaeumannomyces tritici R3-111a-1]|uniref:Peptidase S8/S53 domain-containing protein n=1 Tax=Gaeumannomyces tritici (strain R3-111a-1) TaxID=644352 RepID=J3PE96_GAET3|nr:hypothetical protein GGTG_11819 [Gaeumannomyces tritici R3-111a-1]EJT70796.1 hypothetical protein GGTG_11819 [Gaeumannomyces tritici R3-111a-1]